SIAVTCSKCAAAGSRSRAGRPWRSPGRPAPGSSLPSGRLPTPGGSMTTRLILAAACVFAAATPAIAQAPYTLAAPVPHLATIFTDLFGPRGLVVDSLATLP